MFKTEIIRLLVLAFCVLACGCESERRIEDGDYLDNTERMVVRIKSGKGIIVSSDAFNYNGKIETVAGAVYAYTGDKEVVRLFHQGRGVLRGTINGKNVYLRKMER
ncbi:hypothetical protein NNJEOMEG_02646 [Fundidesulfovibrio magnetotacticus]|uniref:Lipoprotein n=1 Tax=Fundidesulfovibrio magnetotacticus TaxID=2730080 RepID=A0A6V8LX06_9BACT|nr:hypothetical protein [Fundidesulfovibrio magnetotacticus]GFK94798.1 hypothetical protein NNJEOMEG_02646 [Fundidesulfovibrio magnetotacticus]